jgi:hypothetical protein
MEMIEGSLEPLTTVLTPSNPLSASPTQTPSPRHVSNEPTWALEVKQCVYNIVMDREKEMSVERYSHKDSIALELPIQVPIHPTPTVAPCQAQDDPSLPMGATPVRSGLLVISPKHPMGDMHSPTIEAGREQHRHAKAPSRGVEGLYLASATTYIQEHLNRRTHICDAFTPRVTEELPSRAVKMEAGQSHTDDISRGTTDGMEHIPCSTMGPMLPALSLSHPM